MTYKAPSLAELQAQCDTFNAIHPVGGRVAVNLDGSYTPRITTTRSPAQILSGHSAVVWLDGESGCYALGHVAPIPLEDDAWAVLASSGNVIYWSCDRDQVAEVARQHGCPYGQYTPRAPRAAPAWSADAPTEQGGYWHWNGDRDSAPFFLNILWSGSANKCFIARGQVGDDAVFCDRYGGYWMRAHEPALPDVLPAKADGWKPVTGAGQVRMGDKLRFTIGDKTYSERAKLILHEGTDKEEVIYDKGRNFYFITAMVLSGFSNHKGVEFLPKKGS